MATADEIAARALRRLNVYDALQTASAEDLAHANDALTAMVLAWEADGLSGDLLPIDARFEQAIVALLAVRLSEDYGKAPGPVLLRDADNGWSQLSSAFFAVPKSQFDTSLVYTGQGSNNDIVYGNTAANFGAWMPNTDYALRQSVVNNANLFECTQAGTSAASGGPTGQSDEIIDGTVYWCWRRVTG